MRGEKETVSLLEGQGEEKRVKTQGRPKTQPRCHCKKPEGSSPWMMRNPNFVHMSELNIPDPQSQDQETKIESDLPESGEFNTGQ